MESLKDFEQYRNGYKDGVLFGCCCCYGPIVGTVMATTILHWSKV